MKPEPEADGGSPKVLNVAAPESRSSRSPAEAGTRDSHPEQVRVCETIVVERPPGAIRR